MRKVISNLWTVPQECLHFQTPPNTQLHYSMSALQQNTDINAEVLREPSLTVCNKRTSNWNRKCKFI